VKLRILIVLYIMAFANSAWPDADADRLVGAMLSETPLIGDLQTLTDEIGGRVTGSAANETAIDWALARFEQAGVGVRRENFDMPFQWRELHTEAEISGDHSFTASVIAKPFSKGADRLTAPLLDAGMGTAADFQRVGEAARGAWLLVETALLDDTIGLRGLFDEFGAAETTEALAFGAGAAGIVFMSSRPKNLLYRMPSLSARGRVPQLLMEREHAQRALRLLREGKLLTLAASIMVDSGYKLQSANVIGEIRGTAQPAEIVLFGAHLDSHDLGTGALDNGSNVVMLIDIARQIKRLGLQPRRTIRFALWNGEEQGIIGSWRYTQQHLDELDQHVVAASFDIGTGRILGFFTGGMDALGPMVDGYLAPVAGMGPFQQVNLPLVGTDNFDFMMHGVPNLIAVQADANYASNYHAASDTFDKVDQQQLKLNSAITAAVIWGFANSTERLPRHSRKQIEQLVETSDLERQMRQMGMWESWVAGERGRQD
jgi:hypothetical protein